ncbi:AAA family ATPase [Paenibacillus alginolyticus]|uniref:ATP-binding protein n=1 Tax=Paenibacillus alginolyticus TaxID=59839 RepID=A0ABT4G7W9_9BACL|nr:ATP-binding protein [Paenibacillus alginolyticus]MCY9692278.1 ATP-binding protein [Paenibacillus alginolyticus]MEC0145881.1 ATP-binding protein [Paenibacillus alginolyticus]
MLIEYRVKNFKSYKDEVVLSMVADKNRELAETNLFKQGSMTLLKTAAIFGANASGKTNFIESINFLSQLMKPKTDVTELFSEIPNFKLDASSIHKPISYEITFFLGNQRHRYGIELDKEGICSEWLYFVPKRQEACYFERERNEITNTGSYFEERKALDYIKPDSHRPFLFTLGQDSVKQFEWAKRILRYLRFYIKSSSIPDSVYYNMIREELLEDNNNKTISKEDIVSILRSADTGIKDISFIKEIRSPEEKEMLNNIMNILRASSEKTIEDEKYETVMHHNKFDDNNSLIGEERFPLESESRGTVKLYALQYPILQVLKKGGILLIDEIESSLHPLLCEKIISLFNSKDTNPKNAQLIFTTHNTLLMHPKLLRRDQILFTEKNNYGASTMYSLYDIDLKVRNNFNYLNNYLSGRFGAIPYLSSFGFSTEDNGVDADEG